MQQSHANSSRPTSRRISSKEVAKYYDTHNIIYRYFWSSTALHYGIWYSDTKSLDEAIKNTNMFVVDTLAVHADDVVLDAGCGVGGTTRYIAESTGAQVVGITVSPVQLRVAQRSVRNSEAADRVTFSLQDYTRTNFADSQFSKVLAIESVCYANEKIDFIREAFRILKPGGRLVVIDAFLSKEELDSDETEIYREFAAGWVVPNLATRTGFSSLLGQAGFTQIAFHDLHQLINKSVQRIYRFGRLTSPINCLLAKLGLARKNRAAIHQKALFERRIAIYGAFVAAKVP